jgi:hypothetical protein
MHSRIDFIKDPAERRWVARCQAVAALLFMGLMTADIVLHPDAPIERPGTLGPATEARPAQVPAPAQPAGVVPERTIGHGEGA